MGGKHMSQFRIVVIGVLVGLVESSSSLPLLAKDKASDKKEQVTDSPPRIAKKWQLQFREIMESDTRNFVRGWALFSYGGWADQGQILVFESKDGKFVVQKADPGAAKTAAEQVLKTDEIAAFSKATADAQSLGHWESQVLDGLQFEYVALEKKGDKVNEVKRVFMNNPHVSGAAAGYQKLVAGFQALGLQSGSKP
jgi:hypothetical protein